MLVRGVKPEGEERLARARQRRRVALILFFTFLLLVMLAVPFFVSRFSQVVEPDDPAFLRRVAEADAFWTFRPGPVAQHLFSDAMVQGDLSMALSTLHQLGQVFLYQPGENASDPEWVMVISRRRPQRLFDMALRRMFPLDSELGLSPVYHVDRDRFIAASGQGRLEKFLDALEAAGDIPKVQARVVNEDRFLPDSRRVHFVGPWGLLPPRLQATIQELSSFDPDPSTEVELYFPVLRRGGNSGSIVIDGNLQSDEEVARVTRQLSREDPSMETSESFAVYVDGVLLDGTQKEDSATVLVNFRIY